MRLSATSMLLGPTVLCVLVACNTAPTSPVVEVGPALPSTLDDLVLSFTEEATDEQDDRLIVDVSWEVDRGAGFTDASVEGRVVPAALTEKGQVWRATVRVSDGAETAPEVVSAEITVVNTPPTARGLRVTPGSVDTFGTLRASVLADDIDGDSVTLQSTWFVDGTALDVEGLELTGDYFSAGQEVRLEVTPVDDEEAGETATSATIVVSNLPPRATSARIDPAAPTGGSDVTCLVEGWFDPDEDPEGYRFSWLVNGVEAGTGATLAAAAINRDDLVRCLAVPFDGTDTGPTVVSSAAVVANTAPTIGGVSIVQSAPSAGDPITFAATGLVDADSDSVDVIAEWFIDGESAFSGVSLPAGSAVRGQSITVTVTPTDGLLEGEPLTSAPVIVANTAPTLNAVTITPGTLFTNSSAFPEVDVVDVDGDRIRYDVSWTVNGTAISTASVLDGAASFDKGDIVQVTVTPTDGVDTGASLTSDAVEVQNTPPSTPAVQTVPEAPSPGDSLQCGILTDSTDDDDDSLTKTLVWTRNGATYSGATTTVITGDTVPSEDALDGDVYTCTYTVTDGTDTVSAESTVEVLRWRGPRVFTPCGATGAFGPDQLDCDLSYAETPLDTDGVDVTSGVQVWTVPFDGDYRIVASGAAGGAGTSGSQTGYSGAEVAGTFTLSEGDEIIVLAGQMGTGHSSYSASGGGATLVALNDEDLLLVAGGGGANGYNLSKPSGCDGQAGTSARTAGNSFSSEACGVSSAESGVGGTYFERVVPGTFEYIYWYGGGGAGLEGAGAHNEGGIREAVPLLDGATGGRGLYGEGGFGGGGVGGYSYIYTYTGIEYGPYNSSFYGSGGGGGMTGGDGGYYRGGGGSSFISGASQSSRTGANTGDGKVVIDLDE